ncbi:MAG: benzoyl-CoA 2,3-epoxidase subunit BoxA [Burkholderiales bacterium]|nr:benzoyl-CoA 2,3-epoxidase subunit BoxA [Burkholderiales bacterium]
MNAPLPDVIRQHLIDPEICIRCNTCEETCPVDAITHDSTNYVVDPDKCNLCMACVPPCPTGSIDNWRTMLRIEAYTVHDQFGWEELPADKPLPDGAADVLAAASVPGADAQVDAAEPGVQVQQPSAAGAIVPPWSAAHPYVNLHGPRNPVTATVAGNYRVTELGTESDTHHIVLDFGAASFPVLEGQSLGILPPGTDARGRAHHARQYSIASPRDGERPGYNNVSLTVKRVLQDHEGQPVRGVASNFLCDLQKGDTVQVIGPFGTSFLMPNHDGANLIMVCTGTGSAPMRAMTERRRRLRGTPGQDGRLMLFFGARTQQELPYFGPLGKLPKDFIDIEFAYSRTPGEPRRYVQDAMRERAADVAALLRDANTCLYVCGLKSMEAGVLEALRDIAGAQGLDWPTLHAQLKTEGRLHFETY